MKWYHLEEFSALMRSEHKVADDIIKGVSAKYDELI